MKKSFKVILLMLVVSIANLQAQTWVPIWADEFDYTGLPNSDKWGYDEGCATNNSEAQYYAANRLANTRVENGSLVIEAHKEALNGCNYTSGRIKSQYKGDWQYGKFEVRAKFPTVNGSWPAIWFLPSNSEYGGWPKSGEMDLMENVGYEKTTTHYTIHTELYNGALGTQKGAPYTTANLSADYHIYKLEWYPDSLCTFMDGVKTFTYKRIDTDYKKWPFNKSFHILLNLAIGGNWGGVKGIDDTAFPMQFLVDYVRVYQLQTNVAPYTLTTNTFGGGTIAVSPTKNTYAQDEVVSLSATANSGYIFTGWSSDFYSSQNPLSLKMIRNENITANFQKKGELIKNGSFVANGQNWFFGSNGTSLGTFDNKGAVKVTTPNTTNPWEVNLQQYPVPITKGHSYTFTYTAIATNAMGVNAGIGLNSGAYTSYAGAKSTATTTKQTFTKTFTATVTDSVARVYFDLGYNTGTVTISNISLVDNTVITAISDNEQNSKPHVYWNNENAVLNIDNVIGNFTIEIVNVDGKLLYQNSACNQSKLALNVKDKIFIVKLITKDGSASSFKIVK